MVKMKKSGLGLVIPKTLRIGGVTFYQRGGQVIGRVSESREKRSNTLAQFIQRQKMRHTTALWKMLPYFMPTFNPSLLLYSATNRPFFDVLPLLDVCHPKPNKRDFALSVHRTFSHNRAR